MLWKSELSGYFIGCRRKDLGAVPFVNKVYFLMGSLTPHSIRDQKPAKVSPGPEELCTGVKNAKGVWLPYCTSAANMLTQSLSFLSTIWDGNFPIRIFPISLRNLDLSPLCRPGLFFFQLLGKQVAFESLIWMASRRWHMLKRQNTFSAFCLTL